MLMGFVVAGVVAVESVKVRFMPVPNPPRVLRRTEPTSEEMAELDPGMDWTEAIVSWNVQGASVWTLTIDARVRYDDRDTKWYRLGVYEPGEAGQRLSVDGQADADGNVFTDTLRMKRPGGRLQLRVSGSRGPLGVNPELFLGVSFADTRSVTPPDAAPPHRSAWGKTIDVPQRAQGAYPRGSGLCSPTSLSMVLWHWSRELKRPEMNRDVPEIEANVYDPVYKGCGNWPFNTAFAGSFPGMRAYVARLESISQLEKWIEAGVPIIVSVSNYLLNGKPLGSDEQGHLVVVVGFTDSGQVVLNDPAKRDAVRRTISREDFAAGWAYSKKTVYLIYPAAVEPLASRGGWLEPAAL